jgi:hypothetical protein
MVTSPNIIYNTPDWVTQALLDNEKFEGNCWEPACGNGAISSVLEKNNLYTVSSDIQGNYGFRHDFLNSKYDWPGYSIDNIITNPPFSLAQDFIEEALIEAESKVAMLLRLAFLESSIRKEFFERTPLKKVLVSSKRITMYPTNYGGEMKNGGTMAMGWFIWDHAYTDKPQLGWF